MSGSSISWAACKSAPCSRQITRPDALPATQPTASKHWSKSTGPVDFAATRPVWARGRCRISPRFLSECCKRQLNQGSLVLLYFRLSTFSDLYWVCLSVFSCTVLFVSISQVIGCEDRLRNDLYCVGWGVKLYSNQTLRPKFSLTVVLASRIVSAAAVGEFQMYRYIMHFWKRQQNIFMSNRRHVLASWLQCTKHKFPQVSADAELCQCEL